MNRYLHLFYLVIRFLLILIRYFGKKNNSYRPQKDFLRHQQQDEHELAIFILKNLVLLVKVIKPAAGTALAVRVLRVWVSRVRVLGLVQKVRIYPYPRVDNPSLNYSPLLHLLLKA